MHAEIVIPDLSIGRALVGRQTDEAKGLCLVLVVRVLHEAVVEESRGSTCANIESGYSGMGFEGNTQVRLGIRNRVNIAVRSALVQNASFDGSLVIVPDGVSQLNDFFSQFNDH